MSTQDALRIIQGELGEEDLTSAAAGAALLELRQHWLEAIEDDPTFSVASVVSDLREVAGRLDAIAHRIESRPR